MGGMALAGAIAAALLKRERTGEAAVIDVSLLATALWQISPLVVAAKLFGLTSLPRGDRRKSPNPGVGVFRTADDRYISLILLQSDRYWEDFAARPGAADPGDRRAVQHLRGPLAERTGVHRHHRRGLRRADPWTSGRSVLPTSRGCGRRSRRWSSSTTTPR